MIATPNATMRAIRIYGSESQWGKEARWTPPHQPYEAFDFPQEGCVGRIFFGEVPDQICQQIHARHAFANACLNRLMGGDEASLDEAVEAAKAAQSMPVYDEEAWYVTLVFDQPVYLPESPNTPSAYAWWDTDRVSRADQKFRAIADQSLNALAGHCSLVMEPIFFETRVTERDLVIILADGRPVSFVPRLVGSARIAVGKDADNFPTDELQDRLRSLTAGTVQAHQSLRQAVGWWVASLSMNNQWQKFQAAFLALELLTEKLAPRYRDKVSARLEYRDYGSLGRPLAELIVSEAGGKRMPLVSKFAIVALQLDPANADQDLCEFRAAKKARDGLAHGSISQAEDLPVGQIFDLARKYLALALLRTAPD